MLHHNFIRIFYNYSIEHSNFDYKEIKVFFLDCSTGKLLKIHDKSNTRRHDKKRRVRLYQNYNV